jgi:hypothetical protein
VSALALLIRLQLGGWVRYLGRSVRTVRGALLVGVGLLVLGVWLSTAMLGVGRGEGMSPDDLLRFGPVMLLLYCVLNVLTSTSDKAVYFSPAEIQFLFTGPFTRRAVLGYKVALTLLLGLPTALILSAIIRIKGAWLPAVGVGVVLTSAFLQLFSMALALSISAAGARLYSRGRQLALASLVALAAVLLVQSGALHVGDWSTLRDRVLAAPAWQVVSAPLRWFFQTMLAREPVELILYAARAAVVDLALLGVLFGLDASYLEASATASARLYARVQRLRGRNMEVEALPGQGAPARPRFELPALPYWGGAGPVLWRQLTAGMRGLGRLGVVMLVLVVVGLPGFVSGARGSDPTPMLIFVIFSLTVFLTALVPFDFRGDLDRMATLKTLPAPAWALALGQVLAPTLILTAVHWLLLLVLLALVQGYEAVVAVAAAYAPAFDFLLLGLENLLFLLFPTRIMAATPGDFQALGRNVLLTLGKVVVLVVVAVPAGVVGMVVGGVTGNAAAGAAAALPVVVVAGAALIPLLALAFKAFDVGRDTPA